MVLGCVPVLKQAAPTIQHSLSLLSPQTTAPVTPVMLDVSTNPIAVIIKFT